MVAELPRLPRKACRFGTLSSNPPFLRIHAGAREPSCVKEGTATASLSAATQTVVPLVPRGRANGPRAEDAGAKNTLVDRRIPRDSGIHQTSPAALRRRLIGPWGEGLRQYLALRLRSEGRAESAFRDLKRLIIAAPTEELLRDAGPKANVYRLARRLADEHEQRAKEMRELGQKSISFRPLSVPHAGVPALREQLAREHAEVLELRYARELSAREIATVLELEDELDAEAALLQAREAACALIGAHDTSLYLETFALTPPNKEVSLRVEEAPSIAPGTLVGGRYRLLACVGVGAFGDVYEAVDEDVPGHRVALKVLREPALSQSARNDALRELKLTAAVFHPSIVVLKDHGWFENRLWFVMPWYEGETLDKRIRASGGLSRGEARAIFEPLAHALIALHASAIRHQDIKPDNVFLARLPGNEACLPVLLDLGVAAGEHEALLGGTPLYFAPEVAAHYSQQAGAREVGPKADVFALALSLRNALEPETEEDVVAGAIGTFIEYRAEHPPHAPVRADLRYLAPHFQRWLATDPEARPTAEEFARELAMLTLPEERSARRRRTAAWLLPLSILVALSFGWMVRSYSEASATQRAQIAEARNEVDAVRADLELEEAARASDRAALAQAYAESNLTRQEMTSRLVQVESESNALMRRLGNAMTTESALRASLASAEQSVLDGNARETSLREAISALDVRITSLNGELEARATAAEETRLALRAELDDTRRLLGEAQHALVSLQQELNETERDVASAEAERDRADERVRELEARLARRASLVEAPAPVAVDDEPVE